jgi:Flp pilus assembly protein TadB
MCIEPQWLLRSPDHELPPRRSLPPVPARVVGYVAAGWCLGFAGVSAWLVAGGVTLRAILYVLFFLAGAALLGALAVWFHRRHRLRWTSAVAGLAGAPLLPA